MSPSKGSFRRPLEPELLAVAKAAAARLRAQADENLGDADAAGEALRVAASSAMVGGFSLPDIAQAEARGQEDARREMGGDALKRVERSGDQARQAEAEHQRAIARAMRLGLSTRQIASAAGVTHGTIRAIGNRVASGQPARELVESQPPGI